MRYTAAKPAGALFLLTRIPVVLAPLEVSVSLELSIEGPSFELPV